MRYTTEWVVILVIMGCALGTVYQVYSAGHLFILLPAVLVALLLAGGLHLAKSRRQL